MEQDKDKIKITKGYWDFDKTLLKYKTPIS